MAPSSTPATGSLARAGESAPARSRLPAIDPERCTGCGRCVAACGPHVLSLEVIALRKRAVLHEAPGCTGCSQCAVVCPFDAIRMRRTGG